MAQSIVRAAPAAALPRPCTHGRPAAAASPLRLPLRPPRTVCAASRLEVALQSFEARVDACTAAAGAGADRAARAFVWLVRLLTTELRRLLRWLQLAAVALALQPAVQQQQQLALAGAAAGSPVGDDSARMPSAAPAAAAVQAPPQEEQPAAGPASSQVMDFLSAATTGAVEQLRHTLMDASQGIESKMSALERTASSVQGTLFQAARAHSEAVRSNPQVGMWKQPSVDAVLSEEERLRQAVFAQVYAELLQKDNRDLSFNAQAQP
ncbi:hypothetical protein ABPG75_009967 [Micractinium tetrahymenae]